MNAIDFEYDNQYLSDYGFIICDFNASSGADTISAGSNLTFNTVPKNRGRQYSLASTQYDECITVTFDICKNPETHEEAEMELSSDECRDLMRWLNRREFLKFQVLYDEPDYDSCTYNASFNVSKIVIAEKVVGLELEMTSDKPFAYGQERYVKLNIIDTSKAYNVIDSSDDIGFITPNMVITCNSAGDLEISNSFCDCTLLIKNCTAGEIITIDGENLLISSSLDTHQIYNDFNFEFLKIGNNYYTSVNPIKSNLACTIEISYNPIIKQTP